MNKDFVVPKSIDPHNDEDVSRVASLVENIYHAHLPKRPPTIEEGGSIMFHSYTHDRFDLIRPNTIPGIPKDMWRIVSRTESETFLSNVVKEVMAALRKKKRTLL